ncbi:MAG: release factor glutamine methyltransferase [Halioglobus sp.]|jgi:release factor glutamine methyltransferase
MPTVAELLSDASTGPGESARRDAEILLCHCLKKSRTWLYTWPESIVLVAQAEHFLSLVASRRAGVPVAYLLGRREFWTLNLLVNEHTLIPRPETETLVEWALSLPLPSNAGVLDLGTGCGAIALALASERSGWQVVGVDASEKALQVAVANSIEYTIANTCFFASNWYQGVAGQGFDLLVSNPPYVEGGDSHLSQGDVRFEPVSALVAAEQGLADLRALVSDAPEHLHSGGWLLLEHGFDQGEAVRALLHQRGFTQVETRLDLAGLERISGGQWHAE